MRWRLVLVLVAACGDDGGGVVAADAPAMTIDAWVGPCDPIGQRGCSDGEKCAWGIRAGSGGVECVPAGAAQLGSACTFPTTEPYIDDCAAGLYCGPYESRCKRICTPGAGMECASGERCDDYAGLFAKGSAAPFAGTCERPCEPLADNDFDGTQTVLVKSGSACGTATEVGCYGMPSHGTYPPTRFVCASERATTFRAHRDPVAAGGAIPLTICSQGYLPLLYEATGITTVVCVALCQPANCYSGNCGTNDENRLGVAPHRCNDTDRRGTFDTTAGGEHCKFLWRDEIEFTTNAYLPSSYSDSVGYCWDHSKYAFMGTTLPACAQLQDGWGPGTDPSDPLTYWGAADLGCVDSTRLPVMANGKRALPPGRPRYVDDVRPLYVAP